MMVGMVGMMMMVIMMINQSLGSGPKQKEQSRATEGTRQ